jgi:hypothetical protein
MAKPSPSGSLRKRRYPLLPTRLLSPFFSCRPAGGDDCRAIGGVLAHLVEVAAHDGAPPGEHDRLGLVVDLAPRLHQNEGNQRRGIVEDEVAHELVGSLPHPQNIEQSSRFEFGDRLGADHAAVGDDADPIDAKAALQTIDRRDQAGHIGGVSRPHLGAHRPAFAVEEHGQNRLVEIGPVVLGEAAPSERLAARALEIEAGRVQEHDVERGQEIAP